MIGLLGPKPGRLQRVSARFRSGGVLVAAARAVLLLVTTVAIVGPLLPLKDPGVQDLSVLLEPPSSEYLFGTDDLGRDLLSRVIYGARTSLLAAAIAVVTAGLIGVPLGLLSGYSRGLIDAVLSRIADAVMAVPPLILTLAAVAALGRGLFRAMFILGLVMAPRIFRVIRASAMTVAGSGFVEAGKLSGCGTPRLLTRYVLPNVRDQVAVQLSFLLGYAILIEAGLSFLGLGVRPPDPSLGVLLRGATSYLETAPHVVLIPGTILTALILSANVVGDELAGRSRIGSE